MPKKKGDSRDRTPYNKSIVASLALTALKTPPEEASYLQQATDFILSSASTLFSGNTASHSEDQDKPSIDDEEHALLSFYKERQDQIKALFSEKKILDKEYTELKTQFDSQTFSITNKISLLQKELVEIDMKVKQCKESNLDVPTETLEKQTDINTRLSTLKKQLSEQKAKSNVPQTLLDRRLEILENIDNLLVEKVDRVSETIRRHAQMRVDLFFLLMIALYRKNVLVSKGSTDLQHGIGSKTTGTAGCHASLFPHIDMKKQKTAAGVASYVPQFFQSTEQVLNETDYEDIESFLKDTHFEDVSNLTNELPDIVNKFDCHLEGTWDRSNAVKECVNILNQVSNGALHPIDGMTDFAKVMSLFFHHMEYKYVIPPPTYTNSGQVLFPKAFAKVCAYEKEGTFRIFQANLHVKYEYLNMVLGLKKLNEQISIFRLALEDPINIRINEMQEELLSNKSYRVALSKK